MPADAPRIKLETTRANGATVVTYDRVRESREEIGAKFQSRGQDVETLINDLAAAS